MGERPTPRGPGRPGATAGSRSVLTGGVAAMTDRTHCVDASAEYVTQTHEHGRLRPAVRAAGMSRLPTRCRARARLTWSSRPAPSPMWSSSGRRRVRLLRCAVSPDHARMILIDKRGTGMSDRVAGGGNAGEAKR
jgi:hypothetical protein